MPLEKLKNKDFFPRQLFRLSRNRKFIELFGISPLHATYGAYCGFPIIDIEFYVRYGGDTCKPEGWKGLNGEGVLRGFDYIPSPENYNRFHGVKEFADVIQKHRHSKRPFPHAFSSYDEASCKEKEDCLNMICDLAKHIYQEPYSFLDQKLGASSKDIRSPLLMEIAKQRFQKECSQLLIKDAIVSKTSVTEKLKSLFIKKEVKV